MNWFWGGQEESGRIGAISYQLPKRIRLEKIPDDQTLSRMLETGELDALITPNLPSPFARGSPKVKRLFPNYNQVEMDNFKRTKIFPIMHTVVIRGEIYREHPWVAPSLFKAFSQAKAIAEKEMYATEALRVMLPWLIDHIEATRALMGNDYWTYGLEQNRATLDALTIYLVEQGLAERKLEPEELFAPNTLQAYRI